MSADYKHHGMREPGTWGAQTAPVGAKTDAVVQRAREAIAWVLTQATPWEWDAPKPARMEARERAR